MKGKTMIPRSPGKRSKHNVRIDPAGKLERTADGHLFGSKGELKLYLQLKILERIGEITFLEVHPKYPIFWPGTDNRICIVELDFTYKKNDEWIYEDFKGADTALSKMKRKLVEAAYGITVKLVTKKDLRP